jgi:hypothetical protein
MNHTSVHIVMLFCASWDGILANLFFRIKEVRKWLECDFAPMALILGVVLYKTYSSCNDRFHPAGL